MAKLAVIQRPAAVLNRDAAIAAAVAAIAEASAQGAGLVVFPEASIPGYPAWIWRLRPGTDSGLSARLHGLLLDQAVIIRRGDLEPLTEAARTHGVTVVCGANERDDEHGGGTIYNTVIVIGPDGSILNRHRKLMPTNPERMVWGFGDGSSLKVVDTPAGRLGALICWENYMPLARYALYGQGIEVYVAPTYDNGDGWIGTLQHIAIEGACWVIGSGCVLRGEDFPSSFPERTLLYPEPKEWVNAGDSVVIAPGGKIIAGPLRREVGILYAEYDLERVGLARRSLDIVGHYSRPDIFQLHVNTEAQSSVKYQ
jgi:nitrilase